ncbi:MAG: hypothetical protein Q7R78_01555 [bacterium]|nr:hypothetical protein [bacterium]
MKVVKILFFTALTSLIFFGLLWPKIKEKLDFELENTVQSTPDKERFRTLRVEPITVEKDSWSKPVYNDQYWQIWQAGSGVSMQKLIARRNYKDYDLVLIVPSENGLPYYENVYVLNKDGTIGAKSDLNVATLELKLWPGANVYKSSISVHYCNMPPQGR